MVIGGGLVVGGGGGGGEHASIHDLLVSRLRSASPQRKAGVRMPGDSRLKRICEAIIADPSDSRTIDDWACDIGMNRRSEEHTSELQSLMRNSYAVFCLKKKNNIHKSQPQKKSICL